MPVVGGGGAGGPVAQPLPFSQDTVQDVWDLIRAMMNDRAYDPVANTILPPAVWVDAVLLPFTTSAYRRFQRDIAARGVHHKLGDVIITLPAGGTQLDFVGTAPNALLPNDFLFPVKLSEKQTGSTNRKTPMLPRPNGLPDRDPQQLLREYQSMAGSIQFVGSTSSIDITMRYERALPKLGASTDPIRIVDAVDCLAMLTIMRAARAKGVTQLVADMKAEYNEELQLWLMEYFKPQQRYPVRRRAYGSRRRAVRL